jgi:hypothetical protein
MAAEPGSNDAAVAIGSLLAGAGAGGALLTLTVLIVRGAQAGSPQDTAAVPSTGATALAMGSVGALALAAGVAFVRAREFGIRWQRVAVAAIAAFATAVPGLVAIPLDRALGPPGLVILALSCVVLAVVGWRWGR